MSPVEERHIDYILEEEFSVNPDFLRFFVDQARLAASDQGRIWTSANKGECSAVRSATTGKGETDLLVTYRIENGVLPLAILIEDKIRAGFQPDQAKRYRARGEEGKGNNWSNYWTCLVSHSKYAVDKADFDAVVTLQALQEYFAGKADERSQFRARVFAQTIRKYETTGIQNIDPDMTRFRSMYAAECDSSLRPGQWKYEKAREAWWDDTWFIFKGTSWPKGARVVHQARSGRLQLILPVRDEVLLQSLVAQYATWHPNGSAFPIVIVPVGKAKSAFQIHLPKITDFFAGAQPFLFEELFAALEFLATFYKRCSDLLPEHLRLPTAHEDCAAENDPHLRALRAMLLGFLRCTVISLGTEMPYPLPNLQRLNASTPENERYFASPGLMGGFLLELKRNEGEPPYVLSEYWSRQWGTHSVRHKIGLSEVLELDERST